MALGESQDFSWVARGWEAMSFFVLFLYASKETLKISSKLMEEAVEGGIFDMWLVSKEDGTALRGYNRKILSEEKGTPRVYYMVPQSMSNLLRTSCWHRHQ